MPALITIEVSGKIYLLMDRESKCVQGFDTVEEGIAYFERGYNESHTRNYESSMSALMNYITFTPSVHEWNHDDLKPLFGMKIAVDETFKAYGINNVSGYMMGVLLTGEEAEQFHENGLKPKLIS